MVPAVVLPAKWSLLCGAATARGWASGSRILGLDHTQSSVCSGVAGSWVVVLSNQRSPAEEAFWLGFIESGTVWLHFWVFGSVLLCYRLASALGLVITRAVWFITSLKDATAHESKRVTWFKICPTRCSWSLT